jgi:hypothetical protein
MSEFLGVILGTAIGLALSRVHSRRLRALLFVPAVLLAGAVTSAVNGELGSHLWAVLVSFDSVLVGLGVMFGLALTRLRLPHVRASQRQDG